MRKLILLLALSLFSISLHAQEKLKRKDVKTLRKMVYEEKYEKAYFNARFSEELEGISKVDIDALKRISQKRKIQVFELEEYVNLINLGMEESLLIDMPRVDIQIVYRKIIEEKIPVWAFAEWDLYGLDYSVRATRKDSVLMNCGIASARRNIIERLQKKEHLYRSATDYPETEDQVMKIEDPHFLGLINQYIDLFEKEETQKVVLKLLEGDKTPEKGGLVIDTEKGFALLEIQKTQGGVDSYNMSPLQFYMHHIGEFHTHPFNHDRSSKSYAGPSGYAKHYDGYSRQSDMLSLKATSAKMNPFFVDCVISELEDGSFNVDIYFTDVFKKGTKAVNRNQATVIDLGIYGN